MATGLRFGIGVVALLALSVMVLVVSGCSSEAPPPATVREYEEPTDTVSSTGAEPGVSLDTTGGPLEPGLRRELESRVQVLGVGYGAEGAYLVVYFLSPPRLSLLWQPGEMYVVDEATGVKYDDIPFMPKIGRLIARPVEEGQKGYVMLENTPRLPAGSKVTVVLGRVEKSHVTVVETESPVPLAP